MATTSKDTTEPESQIYISEGHVLLSNMLPENVELGRILLFPFMEAEIRDFYGEEYSPTLSPWLRSYKANLYIEIPNELLGEVDDVHNRLQIEKLIRPVLEICLITHALFYQEPILFSFENTYQMRPNETVPEDMTPLLISTLPEELQQLSVEQEYIFEGRSVPHQPVNRRLRTGEDLGNPRFMLVKSSGTGSAINMLHLQDLNRIVFIVLENLLDGIVRNRLNPNVIKALEFIRRAVVQEKLGFHNEAFLNYFRVIEAFANSYNEAHLVPYFEGIFNLSDDEARVLCRARNRVVAHGNQTPGFLREVGQQELYKIRECANSLLQVHLA